jgi:hypothetical protein
MFGATKQYNGAIILMSLNYTAKNSPWPEIIKLNFFKVYTTLQANLSETSYPSLPNPNETLVGEKF